MGRFSSLRHARWLFLPLGVLVACAAASEAETSESNHTEGEYVQANNPLYWNETSYEDFVTMAKTVGLANNFENPNLEQTHPITVRVQTWMDRIDAVVRARVEHETGQPFAAPKPIARIIPTTRVFNAWVSPAITCLGAPFRVANADPSAPSIDGGSDAGPSALAPPSAGSRAVLLATDNGGTTNGYKCVPAPSSWANSDYAEFWNAARPKCALTRDSQGLRLVANQGCNYQGQEAEDTAVLAGSPHIHFATDLLKELDEKTVAVVTAHELAHYYRGHTTAVAKTKYQFWFERGPDEARRPMPAADAKTLQEEYQLVRSVPAQAGIVVPGAHYSSRTIRFIGERLGAIIGQSLWVAHHKTPAEKSRCEEAYLVSPFGSDLNTSGFVRSISEPGSKWYDEYVQAYHRYEAKLRSCAAQMTIGTETNATLLDAAELAKDLWKYLPKGVRVLPRPGMTLSEFLSAVDTQSRAIDAKEEALRAKIRTNRIGFYTTEQEADDLAMELSTKIGLTTEEVLAAWIDFMKAIDRRGFTRGLTGEACEALMKNNFSETDPSGNQKELFVDLDPSAGNHHASCYRLYNLWREARVHKYASAAAPAPLSPPWSELRATAESLSVAPPPVPPPVPAPAPVDGGVSDGGVSDAATVPRDARGD